MNSAGAVSLALYGECLMSEVAVTCGITVDRIIGYVFIVLLHEFYWSNGCCYIVSSSK